MNKEKIYEVLETEEEPSDDHAVLFTGYRKMNLISLIQKKEDVQCLIVHAVALSAEKPGYRFT